MSGCLRFALPIAIQMTGPLKRYLEGIKDGGKAVQQRIVSYEGRGGLEHGNEIKT